MRRLVCTVLLALTVSSAGAETIVTGNGGRWKPALSALRLAEPDLTDSGPALGGSLQIPARGRWLEIGYGYQAFDIDADNVSFHSVGLSYYPFSFDPFAVTFFAGGGLDVGHVRRSSDSATALGARAEMRLTWEFVSQVGAGVRWVRRWRTAPELDGLAYDLTGSQWMFTLSYFCR